MPVFFFGGNTYLKAVAGLAAKIAKADGVVSVSEIKLFKNIFKIDEKAIGRFLKFLTKPKFRLRGMSVLPGSWAR